MSSLEILCPNRRYKTLILWLYYQKNFFEHTFYKSLFDEALFALFRQCAQKDPPPVRPNQVNAERVLHTEQRNIFLSSLTSDKHFPNTNCL